MNTTSIKRAPNLFRFASIEISKLVALLGMVVASASSSAQTQLQPPKPAAPSQGASTPLQGNSPSKAKQVLLTRFQSVKVDNKIIDLRTLPDSAVLKGRSGKTISVARIKQLQARIDGASTAPMMIAQKGQSLKSLAAAPSGTLISLPGGRITRSQDIAKIQTIFAKLGEKRVVKPIPVSLKNVQPAATVGQGITLADAMKRPASEVIQIGSHKYTAEQLRQMDALLKASPREPRGLLERVGTKAARSGQRPTEQLKNKSIRQGDGK